MLVRRLNKTKSYHAKHDSGSIKQKVFHVKVDRSLVNREAGIIYKIAVMHKPLEVQSKQIGIMRCLLAAQLNQKAIMHKPIEEETHQIAIKYNFQNHPFNI